MKVRRIAYGFVMAGLVLSGCSDSNSPSGPSGSDDTNGGDPDLGPVPVLWNMGVDIDEAFTVEGVDERPLKFFEFGFELLDGTTGEMKRLPHFTYVLSSAHEMFSPMRGVVTDVHLQSEEHQDYAIWLKPRGAPTSWLVELDHITNLAVSVGDEVEVGDLLGYATGGIELMVNGPDAHVCPWQGFAPEVRAEYQAKVQAFIEAWDEAKWALPEDNLYHPEHYAQYYTPNPSLGTDLAGCLVQEIPYETPSY